MRRKERLELKPTVVSRPVQKTDKDAEAEKEGGHDVHDLHTHFGNHSVHQAFQEGTSGLDTLIRSSLGMETAGMTFGGSVQEWMGNQGISEFIHRKQLQGGSEEEILPDARDPSVQRIGKGNGEKLNPDLQKKLEEEFDHSFSHVRIHKSTADAASAQALNAHAFTVGADIYFGSGTFAPGTKSGMELLAHELTHVVQHDEGRLPTSTEMKVSSPNDPVELEAVARGAEVARNIGGFSTSSIASDLSGTQHSTIQSHIDTRIGSSAFASNEEGQEIEQGEQSTTTSLSMLRSGNAQSGELKGEVENSVSFEIEINVPLYPPSVFIVGKVKGGMKSKTGSDTSSEVEGAVYAGIRFEFFFVTIDLGVQGNVKFSMKGDQPPGVVVQKGIKELINWKLAKDFLPNLQESKQRIETSFQERKENILGEFLNIYNDINDGDWKGPTGRGMAVVGYFYDTPRENIEDEIKYFAGDINDSFSDLGAKTEVKREQLFNWSKVDFLMRQVHYSTTKDQAMENYWKLRDEVMQVQLPQSLTRMRQEIDRCAPHPNDPNVGFEGNIQFIAGASAQLSKNVSASGNVSSTAGVKDELGSSSWDHSTHSATEASVAISVGDYQFGIGGKFEPNFNQAKAMEIKIGGEISAKTPEEEPEQTAETFLNGLKEAFQSVRQSGTPISAIRSLAYTGLNNIRTNNREYFSNAQRVARKKAAVGAEMKLGLEVEVHFHKVQGSMQFKGVKVTLKQESAVSVGSALGARGTPIKGTATSGTAFSVSYGL